MSLHYTGPGRLLVIPPGITGEDLDLERTKARRPGTAGPWAQWGKKGSAERGQAKGGAIKRERAGARKGAKR